MGKLFLVFSLLVIVSCSDIDSKNRGYSEVEKPPSEGPLSPPDPIDYDNSINPRLDTLKTPTRLLEDSKWPEIQDDMDFEWMLLAIDRQIEKFENYQPNSNIQLGSVTYGPQIFLNSLKSYRKLVVYFFECLTKKEKIKCQKEFSQLLKERFYFFSPIENGKTKKALFTAYHTPKIEASLHKSKDYQVGIHSMPKEDRLKNLTRNEINFGRELEGSPYELFFMKDQFDQYLLHIQGGGKVLYQGEKGNVESKYLTYDGTNRKAFRFISLYMRDRGYINDLSVASQRKFLKENPDRQEEIYDYSPSYVFFKVTEEPPHGSDAVPLTDHRSIATDYRIYKIKGLLTFVNTKKPVKTLNGIKWEPMKRFMIDHDTGGAIKGAARGDLYFGESDYAAFAATQMKRQGDKYFLALKP